MTESRSLPTRGPYLVAALFCETVLDEKDGVKSLIRVIDRLLVQAVGPDVPPDMPPMSRDLAFVIMLKSGDAEGPVQVAVRLTRPSGIADVDPIWQGTIHMEGGTRGHNLVLRMRTEFREPGPYWYSVYVGDTLVTRTPFEVIYTISRTGGARPSPGS